MVQRRRHIAKAFTYRICASLLSGLAAFIVTGDLAVGLAVAPFDFVLKLGFYYVHERIWLQSKFGVIQNESDE